MSDSNKKILEKIYLSSLKFLEPLTPEKTYAIIVEEAVKLVKAKWSSILLDQEGELKRIYSSIPQKYQVKHRKRGLLYKAFKTGKPIVLSAKQIEEAHPEMKKLSLGSDVIIPLSDRKKSIGILAVLSKKEEKFTDEEINTLILFGSMASLAIRKAQLYNDIKKALEIRDFFISIAAHEIRTPITTIFGYTQLLFNNAKQGKELKTEWIESLHEECYRLKFLVNDFLEVNRIKTGRIHYNLKECSIKDIIGRITDNFKFNYPNRALVLRDDIKTENNIIIGDHDRLIQAILNILDNAVKFSPSNTNILLSLKSNESDIIIKIRDQGKGIPRENLTKIFNRFYKETNNPNEGLGLGLGLYLVENIIKQHRGAIRMQSRLDKGTTVEIKLPKAKI